MRVLLDTSVLVAAVIEQHSSHERSFAALERVQIGQDQGVISAHTLAETYATLTKLPSPFRHSPEQALLSIEENLLAYFSIVSLSGKDYAGLVREAATMSIQGGTIYDAVILKCAGKAQVERIYTLNLKHFQAASTPKLAPLLTTP